MGILMLSCADDVQNVYSKYRAAFTYNKVTTTAPLYKALTGAGIFCSIYCQGGKIYFNTPYESKYETLTDINMYMKPIAFNGFIVGLSNLPEMGTTDLPLLCYDRVCPNCFEESISPSLTLQDSHPAGFSLLYYRFLSTIQAADHFSVSTENVQEILN